MPDQTTTTPLLGLSPTQLADIASTYHLPPYTATQIADWIYKKHVKSVDDMTNLPLTARATLCSNGFTPATQAPLAAQTSKDGTKKYLFPTSDKHFVETVFIPDHNRATLCISSQVGCKMKCSFCMTGRQGFTAQLNTADILNQLYNLPERDKITNIVFMGQGEPTDNLSAVLPAIHALTDKWGFNYSTQRITVSTVALKNKLKQLLDNTNVNIAISLHSPTHSERLQLIPAERAYNIADCIDLLKQYNFGQRRLSFEYIVFDGINNTIRHANALLALLRGLNCRVNLIPFHDIPNTPLRGVSMERMIQLRDYLTTHGLFTTIRASRGQDILAACGLLSTAKSDEIYKAHAS